MNKRSQAAKQRWANYRLAKQGGANVMKTNNSDRELLDWAKHHRQNIELRNSILKVALGIGIALADMVGSFLINFYELPTLVSFAQGFFFEIGVLLTIFFLTATIFKQLTSDKDWAMAVAVLAATAAVVAAAVALAVVVALTVALAVLFYLYQQDD